MGKLKKFMIASMLLGAVSTVSFVPPYEAAKEVAYKNCKELNAVYKYGVSKAKGTKNAVKNQKTGKITYKASNAYVSASLYKLNSKLDADKDGIACEK